MRKRFFYNIHRLGQICSETGPVDADNSSFRIKDPNNHQAGRRKIRPSWWIWSNIACVEHRTWEAEQQVPQLRVQRRHQDVVGRGSRGGRVGCG